jgi:excisionase family DNA binding protein
MKESVNNGQHLVTPMLFPYEPDHYWKFLRQIIKEELGSLHKKLPESPVTNSPGTLNKPLYKMAEVCAIFQVTKPTIYDWLRLGKLRSFKIRSRVFFYRHDIEQLLQVPTQ